MSRVFGWIVLGISLWLASDAEAQLKLWTLKGQHPDIRFGYAVHRLDDLNGDGLAEVAIGAPGFDLEEASHAGRLYIVDGLTQEAVFVLTGSEPSDQLGGALGSGADFDGDGIGDFVAGSGRSIEDCGGTCFPPRLDGRVSVFSGATGSELARVRADAPGDNVGASVTLLPDWNGDAVPELAFGSTGITVASHSEAGRITVLSGSDLAPILTIDGDSTRLRLGASMVVLGDADGDGLADLATGAPGYITTHGTVTILSGSTTPIRTLQGDAPDDRFGAALAAVADLDDDGHPELMISAPQALGGRGEVRIHGSATQYAEVLRRYTAPALDSAFGAALADAGDVDGDGVADHAIGAPRASVAGAVLGALGIFSGATGEELFTAVGKSAEDRFGHACAGGFNAPRYADILGASPGADPGGRMDAGSCALIRIAPQFECLTGNVNAAGGAIFDVLTANGSIGSTLTRIVPIDRDEPLIIRVAAPPSRNIARFVLYAYAGFPDEGTQTEQPFGIGFACFDTPYGGNFELPRIIWNNLGEPLLFGEATQPSSPAPTVLVERPSGIGRRARGTIQGFIRDDASANPDGLSITNAIILDVR